MPKIGPQGPSYAGHEGVVQDATGAFHEVNPSKTVEGEDVEGLVVEPVGDFEETPAPGTSGPVHVITYPDDEPAEDEADQVPAEEPAPKRGRRAASKTDEQ